MLRRLKGPPAPEWDSSRIVLFDIFTFRTVTFPFFFQDFTVKKLKSNEEKKNDIKKNISRGRKVIAGKSWMR